MNFSIAAATVLVVFADPPVNSSIYLADRKTSLEEAVSQTTRAPYSKYLECRKKTPGNQHQADYHFKLGSWCQSNKMPEQAYAHFRAAERLDPGNAEIQKRLRRKLVNGTWIDEKEVAEAKKEAERLAVRTKAWREKIKPLIANLDAGKPNAFAELEKATVGTTDHAIVPVVEENMFKRGEKVANLGIKILDHIQHRSAVHLTVKASLDCPWESTINRCVYSLRQRRPQEYFPQLILSLNTDTSFELPWSGDYEMPFFYASQDFNINAQVGKALVTLRNGRIVKIKSSQAPLLIQPSTRLLSNISNFPGGLSIQQTNRASLEVFSTQPRQALHVLKELSQADIELDMQEWLTWYFRSIDPIGEVSTELAIADSTRLDTRMDNHSHALVMRASCFSEDTLISTERGLRPIKDIEAGDLVLSQDMNTGEMSLKPVTKKTQLGVAEMLRVQYDGGHFDATNGHLIFVPMKGWVPVIDLKPDQLMLSPTDSLRITSNKPVGVKAVHNLEVADTHTYFVTDKRILVHDIRPIMHEPVDLPGRLKAELTSLESKN